VSGDHYMLGLPTLKPEAAYKKEVVLWATLKKVFCQVRR